MRARARGVHVGGTNRVPFVRATFTRRLPRNPAGARCRTQEGMPSTGCAARPVLRTHDVPPRPAHTGVLRRNCSRSASVRSRRSVVRRECGVRLYTIGPGIPGIFTSAATLGTAMRRHATSTSSCPRRVRASGPLPRHLCRMRAGHLALATLTAAAVKCPRARARSRAGCSPSARLRPCSWHRGLGVLYCDATPAIQSIASSSVVRSLGIRLPCSTVCGSSLAGAWVPPSA